MENFKPTNLKISAKRPSYSKYVLRRHTPEISALSSGKIEILLWQKSKIYKKSIEGMSVRSFFSGKLCGGSMTVEAALVLPLFFFFLMNLLWIIEIFSLHSTLHASLREVGRELSVYAYAYDSIVNEEEDSGIEALLEDAAFSYLYVKNRVEEMAGREYLEKSPLTYGADGLVYIESDILQEGDIIDLVVTYQVSPFAELIGFLPGRFYTRYYGRAWTGYDVSNTKTDESGGEYVYVAENAEVYHFDRECSHIKLTITECMPEQIESMRNEGGGKYYPCELCITTGQGRLYIAKTGDKYHQLLNCSGLKRTVSVMPLQEAVKKYRMCARCGR